MHFRLLMNLKGNLAWMVTEANSSFLKLMSIYLGMYHKQNIFELYTELKTTFRAALFWVVVILVTLFACFTSESIFSTLVDIILVLFPH